VTGKAKMIVAAILLTIFFAAAANADLIQRTVLRVEKMTCGYCLSQIDKKLNGFDGMVGMRANLRRGIVAVDHQPPLEGGDVADAITSLGYPASIIAQSEIEEEKAFSASSAGQYGGCGGGGAPAASGYESDGNAPLAPDQRDAYSGGCRLQRSGGCCGASASAWKEVYRRYSEGREGNK
jgi:copper chaperone CopZ